MKRQKLVCGYDGLDLLGPGLGNVRICLQFSDKELSRRTLTRYQKSQHTIRRLRTEQWQWTHYLLLRLVWELAP